MQLLGFLLLSAVILIIAYITVGRWLARVFQLSSEKSTPAYTMRDGLDYEPARTSCLMPQHFSAIAAAGPIVGPILAAIYFGWGPAWIWLLLGGIFIGGIHDFVSLIGSVRHRAQSIAEIIRQHMNPRAHLLFMIFVWFALIYVIIAFTDVTAGTFIPKGDSADAPGPAVATSSMIYLVLAILMGATLRWTKLGPLKAKLIYLPLVFGAIVAGQYVPLDFTKLAGANAQRLWGYLLLGYCFFAALAPVWLLLQPRGELGGYFLYIVMAVAVLGVLIGAFTGSTTIQSPFFKGLVSTGADGVIRPLFPILFITVACGACSGFHSIIASGTTSKQIERETDARPIAYGSMLMESFLGCITLTTVMIVAAPKGSPDQVYANGIATLARGIVAVVKPVTNLETDSIFKILYVFALLCFATFVFDTLDACTRLARYVLMEALGWTSRAQAVAATAITLALPCIVLALPPVESGGKTMPLWQVFWGIFGSSNQLLAALTLLGLTVWLARKKMKWWITFFPTIFMMVMTLWSLMLNIGPYLKKWNGTDKIGVFTHLQFGITVMLIGLATWLIVEAIITWRAMMKPPGAGSTIELGRVQPEL